MIRLAELAKAFDAAAEGPFEDCKLNDLCRVRAKLACFSPP